MVAATGIAAAHNSLLLGRNSLRKPLFLSCSFTRRCRAATSGGGGEELDGRGSGQSREEELLLRMLNWVNRNVRDPSVEVDPLTVRRKLTNTIATAAGAAPPLSPLPDYSSTTFPPLGLLASTLLLSAFSVAAYLFASTFSLAKKKKKKKPPVPISSRPFMTSGDSAIQLRMPEQDSLCSSRDPGVKDQTFAASHPLTNNCTFLPQAQDVTDDCGAIVALNVNVALGTGTNCSHRWTTTTSALQQGGLTIVAAHVEGRGQTYADGLQLEDGARVHILQHQQQSSNADLESGSMSYDIYRPRPDFVGACGAAEDEKDLARGVIPPPSSTVAETNVHNCDDGLLHHSSKSHIREEEEEEDTISIMWGGLLDDDDDDAGVSNSDPSFPSSRTQIQKNLPTVSSTETGGVLATVVPSDHCATASFGITIESDEDDAQKAVEKPDSASVVATSHKGDAATFDGGEAPEGSRDRAHSAAKSDSETTDITGISQDGNHMYEGSKKRLTAVVPVLIVGVGAMGFFCGGGLQVVGAGALASLLYRNILWAQNRQSLQRELSSIADRRQLLHFLERKNIMAKVE